MASDLGLDPTIDRLLEQAEIEARSIGSADALRDLPPEEWQRVLDRLAAWAHRDGTTLPDGWIAFLTQHRDRQRLRADVDDVTLAEQGEVFSREDDA